MTNAVHAEGGLRYDFFPSVLLDLIEHHNSAICSHRITHHTVVLPLYPGRTSHSDAPEQKASGMVGYQVLVRHIDM
ncbi:uncharacterized protein BJ212DRAFT_1401208 [Suillus subaureus]|uniref:Uncharacterized protein n=1 Tax=Suillus subaureus TaxID=48587 RepID=A0A9P7DPL7_9AGAM|nr:uncharacterized protein BJ212DRAFT_1401208 [Suillus subaureus]KAG1800017.1 hypothetical protein BJ212DRAFT_1401208 [Suillus subaureus]